jgi:lactoylglutathione lyase
MKFGYTILYVSDVEVTVGFYINAFQMPLGFIHDSKQYAELDTGDTKLAFASDTLALSNTIEYEKNHLSKKAAGIEIALVTPDVDQRFQHATEQGAIPVKEPMIKPWGQTVAYVRDLNGVLVEICSPME